MTPPSAACTDDAAHHCTSHANDNSKPRQFVGELHSQRSHTSHTTFDDWQCCSYCSRLVLPPVLILATTTATPTSSTTSQCLLLRPPTASPSLLTTSASSSSSLLLLLLLHHATHLHHHQQHHRHHLDSHPPVIEWQENATRIRQSPLSTRRSETAQAVLKP